MCTARVCSSWGRRHYAAGGGNNSTHLDAAAGGGQVALLPILRQHREVGVCDVGRQLRRLGGCVLLRLFPAAIIGFPIVSLTGAVTASAWHGLLGLVPYDLVAQEHERVCSLTA